MNVKLTISENDGKLTYELDQGSAVLRGGDDDFINPLSSRDVEDLRWYLEDYLAAPYAVWQERCEDIESKLEDFGERLFHCLFGHGQNGRDAYMKAEDSPAWGLWLRSDSPSFLGIPWELLKDPSKAEPLAFTVAGINRTISRRHETLKVRSGKSLRVLMVIARPSGLNDAGYRAVARPLFEKLDVVSGKVEIDVVRPPTFEAMQGRLLTAKNAGQPYQILHFDGHGTFGTDYTGIEAGYLIFDKNGRQLVSAEKFGSLIDKADVPLVVLNACRSGTLGSDVGPEATVATRLMQSGKTAVVAMGFSVYVRAAAEFMAAFYESLFQGKSVAQGVASGRQQLRRFDHRPSPKGNLALQDWFVPVHYGSREIAFSSLAPSTNSRPEGSFLETAPDQLGYKARRVEVERVRDPLAPVGRFVGRDHAFYQLEQTLDQAPVTLLWGIGGSGKTELAKAFARWLHRTGWAEGAIFHSFEPGIATFGLDGLVSTARRALFGADLVGEAEGGTWLLQILKQHRIVLVLDNFETVFSMPDPTGATLPLDDVAVDELRAFLAMTYEGIKGLVLITSRSNEEWLGEINRLSLGGLDETDVHEFADDLFAGKPGAQKRRQDEAFDELLTMLNGHPRSLHLLLPQLEQQDARALIADLKGQQSLPGRERRDLGYIDSLDASVAYSLVQLDDQDRARLMVLSLFEGVVDADLLAVLSKIDRVPAELADVSRDDWISLLDRITKLGLLSGMDLGCYRLHPALPGYLLRAWREQSGSAFAEELEAVEQALIQAIATFGRRLYEHIRTGRAELAMKWIDLQQQNLSWALGRALARGLYKAVQIIIEPLNAYWDSRGLLIEPNSWLERIRLAVESEAGEAPKFESEAGALWLSVVDSQASRYRNAGQLDQAEAVHTSIAKLQEERGNRPGMAAAYHQLGMVAQNRGDLDAAEKWYKKSLAIEEELKNHSNMATSYHHLGIVVQHRRDLDAAEKWYRKALVIKKEIGPRLHTAGIYHQLGIVAWYRDDLVTAEKWYKKSLAIKEELENLPGMAASYSHLGMVVHRRGDLDAAEKWYKKALVIDEELRNRPDMAKSYHQLGLLAEFRGDLETAEKWYKKSLAIKEELGNRSNMAASYYQLGKVAFRRGDFDAAEKWYKKSLMIEEELGNLPDLVLSYGQLGVLEEARGNANDALDWIVRCNAVFSDFPHPLAEPGPHRLVKLTEALGFPALKTSWHRCTGHTLPDEVLAWVKSAMSKMSEPT